MIIQGKRDFLFRKGADLLTEAIKKQAGAKGRVVFGVGTGNGVVQILELLAGSALPWDSIHIFQLDAGLDSDQQDPVLGRELCRLFGKYLEPDQLHLYPRYVGDSNRGLQTYMDELTLCGGMLDLILVSCGENGGISGLFPNHAFLENRLDGYALVEDLPESPHCRVIAGSGLLARADTGIMVALGPAMVTPLNNFFDTYLSELECPAKLMTRLNHYYLLTDQDVAVP